MGIVAEHEFISYFHLFNWDFFTKLPKPVGETGGGMANAIVGTFKLLSLASCVGLPVGFLGGVYLSEFGDNRIGFFVRYAGGSVDLPVIAGLKVGGVQIGGGFRLRL